MRLTICRKHLRLCIHIDWYEEDQTSKILDEFLNNELEKNQDSMNTTRTVTTDKQIPLAKIFDNKDMTYSKSTRKRRRTEETARFSVDEHLLENPKN